MELNLAADQYYAKILDHLPYKAQIIFSDFEISIKAKNWGYEHFGDTIWTGDPYAPAAEFHRNAKWCMAWMNDTLIIPTFWRVKIWFYNKEDYTEFLLRWS